MPFDRVEDAIEDIRDGKVIIVVDDAKRENEGDLVFAAEKSTPEMVNFALKHGRGILCAPMAPAVAERLGLRLMVSENSSRFGTPFTESVDARKGTSTGTSAFDRARTLRALADPRTRASDLVRPGHIFPLRAVPGGVLRRAGHTEAAPDLCELAGLRPVGGLCEILTETGRMARLPQLVRFATQHRLGILTIRDLIAWRRRREVLVEALGSADREQCVTLCLDVRHRLIAATTVSFGSIDHTFMSPREVLRDALLHNAAAIVVAHNHPSGTPNPPAMTGRSPNGSAAPAPSSGSRCSKS